MSGYILPSFRRKPESSIRIDKALWRTACLQSLDTGFRRYDESRQLAGHLPRTRLRTIFPGNRCSMPRLKGQIRTKTGAISRALASACALVPSKRLVLRRP